MIMEELSENVVSSIVQDKVCGEDEAESSSGDPDKQNITKQSLDTSNLLNIPEETVRRLSVTFSDTSRRLSSLGLNMSRSSSMSLEGNNRASTCIAIRRTSVFQSSNFSRQSRNPDPTLVVIMIGLLVIIIFVVIFTTLYEPFFKQEVRHKHFWPK